MPTTMLTVVGVCPHCGGTTPLMSERSSLTSTAVIERFAGKRVRCEHQGCGKTYWLYMRGDLEIRRTDG